ncbi:hypothetical protein MMC25_003441 [Agyrium rufum]|nr:hypothetical protein [Agyrium rufum]
MSTQIPENPNDPAVAENSVDLEVDRTPFINPHDLNPQSNADPTKARVTEGQAEIFIGRKTSVSTWDPVQADAADHVDLNVLASSNPLFADYQPHCPNVFSMVDNFEYMDANGQKQHLDEATCDYFVLGWHSSADCDPFTTANVANVIPPLHADRLAQCKMDLKDATGDLISNWLQTDNTHAPSRALSHSTMYGVHYRKDGKPTTILADSAGSQLLTKQSIAVGSNPMEALMAYCRAHAPSDATSLTTLENDMLRLETLLASSGDDVEGIQAADDEKFEEAFQKLDGGTKWHFHQESDPTTKPTDTELGVLQQLNEVQATYSNLTRELKSLRWQLFANWWAYVSGFGQERQNSTYQIDVGACVARMVQLVGLDGQSGRLLELKTSLDELKAALTAAGKDKIPQQGTADRFYQRKDPTILFGNIKGGWDSDFSDNTQVRLIEQAVLPKSEALAQGWTDFTSFLDGPYSNSSGNLAKGVVGKLPADLQRGARTLCMEFYALCQLANSKPPSTSVALPQVMPWFHDEDNAATGRQEHRGRDVWNDTQPWNPLFIEYEALYYHIPFEKFSIKESTTQYGATTVHYGFTDEISQAHISDTRAVAGRVLLVPQAGSTLANTLRQVFANTNQADLNALQMPKTEQDNLLNGISQLEFVSSPMTGLTSHILTLHDGGMHVKPTVRFPNASPVVITAASTASAPININDSVIKSMDTETTLLPYGNSVSVNADAPPLKLVTHGQVMFTKINVIDKFGQAISAIDPKPYPRDQPMPTITPCLSDSYFPGTVGDVDPKSSTAIANTVVKQSVHGACPFIQLTPSINQPARLNAMFMSKVDGTWQPCSEWTNPIWGWLVVNYAEQGLQIFLQDGTFYREVRQGGPVGTEAPLKWLPFDPPQTTSTSSTKQLDFLIAKLRDPAYLQGFFDMITQSIGDNQVAAPNSYATYSSAIIGKPVALVNMGWSLELAGAENRNWSTVNQAGPDRHLLKSNPLNSSFVPDEIGGYTFPIKIGDKIRSFDGLIGYYNAATSSAANQSDLDLGTIHTYYAPTKVVSGDPRQLITPDGAAYPHFTPHYPPVGKQGDPIPPQAMHAQVFGAIMDPFLPIHAYSTILPNQSLQLPSWTVEDALKKITAFWHIGPLIVPFNLPQSYDLTRALDTQANGIGVSNTGGINPVDPTKVEPKVAIPLPTPSGSAGGSDAEFRYLQPYLVASPQDTDGDGTKEVTRYNVFGISADASTGADAKEMRLVAGPYTALEGYVQIVKSAAS